MSRSLSVATADTGIGGIFDLATSTGPYQKIGSQEYANISIANNWVSRTLMSAAAASFCQTLTSQSPAGLQSISDPTFSSRITPLSLSSAVDALSPYPQALGNTVVNFGSRALVFTGSDVAQRTLPASYVAMYVNPANANEIVAINSSGSTLSYSLSTDGGNSWSANATVSATLFSSTSLGTFNASVISPDYLNVVSGELYHSNTTASSWQFRFPARVITVGLNSGGTAMVASSSTTGYGSDVNTDASSAVLGTTSGGSNTSICWFKNNGNNCFFVVGSGSFNGSSCLARFSTNGGATWATPTGSLSGLTANVRFVQNTSDAQKFLQFTNSSSIATTTNFGQSFTTRTLPTSITNTEDTIAWTGSIGVYVDNNGTAPVSYVTTNDWATITTLNTPAEVTGLPISTWALDTRIFILYTSGQVAVTTDGINFSIRASAGNMALFWRYSRAAKVGNNIALALYQAGQSRTLVSYDNGVTWVQQELGTQSGGGSAYGRLIRTIDTGPGYFYFTSKMQDGGNSLNQTNSEQLVRVNAGAPASFALSTTAISSLRTGAIAHMRIA